MLKGESSVFDLPIQFVGILPTISANLDISYRSLVLTEIEKGKVALKIAFGQRYKSNALLHIDGRNLKVVSDNSQKEMFIKIPLHHIGAISYLFENNIHIIVVKYGEVNFNYEINDMPDSCFLAIFFCDSKSIAEKICYCVDTCFKIIYSENRDAGNTESTYTKFGQEPLSSQMSMQYAFRSNSFTNLDRMDHFSRDTSQYFSMSRQTSVESNMVMPAAHEAQINNVAQQLISEYMEKLSAILSKEEFEAFVDIVKSLNSPNFDFNVFCQKLSSLFGETRLYLLKDMSPFIAAKDMSAFQTFLKQINQL